MLRSLTVSRRPGSFVVLSGPIDGVPFASVQATVVEDEGLTVVVPLELARAAGREIELELTWLTLDVRSALDAVGLTAAVSAVLADAGIPCNVLAGYHHDHLLVPTAVADDAIGALSRLADPAPDA